MAKLRAVPLFLPACGLALALALAACGGGSGDPYGSDSNGNGTSSPTYTTLLEYVDAPLSSAYAVPTVSGRAETGSVTVRLREDEAGNLSVSFSITVTSLDPSDMLTAAHIHEGSVTGSGGVFVGLVDGSTIAFSGATASGAVDVTAAEAAALQDSARSFYVNVHSTQVGSGLARAQLGVTIDRALNIALAPDPPLDGRSDAGEAILRILDDGTLAYTLVVTDLGSGDTLTNAHIHRSSDSTVFVGFSPTFVPDTATAGRYTATGTVPLTAEDLAALADSAQGFYVNVHSSDYSGGLMRGDLPDPDATLTWIQTNVFTMTCAVSGCHRSPLTTAPMSLEAGAVPGTLVHVASTGMPSLLRVKPGDPDNSILIQRLEGTVTPQMPFGGTPLDAATIARIREWITLGARDD